MPGVGERDGFALALPHSRCGISRAGSDALRASLPALRAPCLRPHPLCDANARSICSASLVSFSVTPPSVCVEQVNVTRV